MTNTNKTKKGLSLFLLLVICLCCGVFAWRFFHSNPPKNVLKEDTQAVGYNPQIKKPKNFDSKQVALPGFSKIIVKEREENANVALANPSFNNVFFKYIITFDKTGEKLLETGLISPGKAVKSLPLPKNISPGKYTLTITIKVYDKKKKSELNGGTNKVPLIVLEK